MPWAEPGLIDEAAVPGRPTGARLIGNWVHFGILDPVWFGDIFVFETLENLSLSFA
jgi:hypothetical protein